MPADPPVYTPLQADARCAIYGDLEISDSGDSARRRRRDRSEHRREQAVFVAADEPALTARSAHPSSATASCCVRSPATARRDDCCRTVRSHAHRGQRRSAAVGRRRIVVRTALRRGQCFRNAVLHVQQPPCCAKMCRRSSRQATVRQRGSSKGDLPSMTPSSRNSKRKCGLVSGGLALTTLSRACPPRITAVT